MLSVKKQLSVFEFSYLGFGSKAELSGRIYVIPESAYTYLKKLCLCDDSESGFLRISFVDNCEVLQVLNYAGVLFTPDGTQIEVLPKHVQKLAGDKALELSRASLLMMLKALKRFRHLKTNNAYLLKNKMPLLEVFTVQFLESVNTLIKRGLRSDYIRCEDNITYLKGRLLVEKQLQYNSINKHKFYAEYDEYLLDRPINRLIHSALAKVLRFTRSATNQKLTRELLFTFVDVPLSKHVKNDFDRVKLDRGMDYYRTPLSWARLILEGFSPVTMEGKNAAFSLLFPMEAVFENYAASILKEHLPNQLVLKTQANSQYLVTNNDIKRFQLKPDLLLENITCFGKGKNAFVLDTKWKLINGTDEQNKYGLSQADFYQMFAYGHKYLNGSGELFLIYPCHDEFLQAINHSFNYDDHQLLKLWIVPFDIAVDTPDCERFRWPENSQLNSLFSNDTVVNES
jgi:5-methylcytosine-specific restriction enzyme subunit McrC